MKLWVTAETRIQRRLHDIFPPALSVKIQKSFDPQMIFEMNHRHADLLLEQSTQSRGT